MFSFALFILSGAAIVTLTLAKRIEEKRKRPVLILKAISRGDERVREYHHKALHTYSLSKEKTAFWVKKQLPMRAKNLGYKSVSYLQETAEKYLGDVRNTRLLKRSEGISEFFKSISEIEKGNGEINETYTEPEVIMESAVVETTPIAVKAPRKRAPRRRKIEVVEIQ